MSADLEIICIGNELLIGKIVNTNASWLAKRATSLGVSVKRITVVADTIEEIATAFCDALERKPTFVISTGGLGPTFDDKTFQGIAKALNRKLSVDEEALGMIKAKYKEYAKTRNLPEGEMTPPRVKMATIPEYSKIIRNPVGTAPGIRVDVGASILLALPGVPREMEAIFEESIKPRLLEAGGNVTFYELSIYLENIMESVLAPLIDKVMADNRPVYIKSHPKGKENKPYMELHLSIYGESSENLEKTLGKAAVELSALINKAGGRVIKAETEVIV
jgi:nicotinamide-nucleotide amidase